MPQHREKPRVVIMQNQLGDLGGVTTFCNALASGLLDRGYPVEIGAVTPPETEPPFEYDPRARTWALVDILSPKRDQFHGLFRKSRFQRRWKQFKKRAAEEAARRFAVLEENTIVIFTQLYAREIVGDLAAPEIRDGRFKVISQYHSSFEYAAFASADLYRVKKEYTDDDLFLCLTASDAELFRERDLNNVSFILNPLTIEPSDSLAALEAKVAVSLGRYAWPKRLDHMIQAWSMLGDRAAGWELQLYGSGPDEEKLRELISELELDSSVHLMGPVEDPSEALRGASVNLLSSRAEGLPLALIEASVNGVPSVAYDCAPGVTEIIENEVTGIVVPNGDLGAFTSGIAALVEDQELRKQYGLAASEYVLQKFDAEQIVDQWERIIANVMR